MQEITRLKNRTFLHKDREIPPQQNKIHLPMTEDPFLKMEGQVAILKGQISL